MKKRPGLAYLMSRFPGLSETFILREMCELDELGWQIKIYPILFLQEKVIHAEVLNWMGRAYNPGVFSILFSNFILLLSRPILYVSLLFEVLAGNIQSLKFLLRAVVLFPKAIWMARQMKRDDIRHIHAHYATHPALAAWIIHRVTNIPYSVTVHAHDIFVDKSMLAPKLKDAVRIVSISQYNREYLKKHLGEWVLEKIEIIHCGVVPDRYINISHPPAVSAQVYNILSIGSLRTYKGFDYLIEACQILVARGFSFRCRIIGGGELYEILGAKIRKLNLGKYVELLGPKNQAEVVEYLKEANCYVQPSIITETGKMEGIPVALMEAMASNLPVIATSISGVPELVRPGETGYLVEPEDINGLADAILYVCAHADEASQCAAAGRDLVMKEFNVKVNGLLMSNLLDVLTEDSQ